MSKKRQNPGSSAAPMKNGNPNQHHNSKKEALGPNTKQ